MAALSLWVWCFHRCRGVWLAMGIGLLAGAFPVQAAHAEAGIAAQPSFIRIDLQEGAPGTRHLPISLQSHEPFTLLSAEGDCRCIHLEDPLPKNCLPGSTDLTLVIQGLTPGLKHLTLRTTRGSALVVVQVVGQGLGSGRSQLETAVRRCRDQGWTLTLVVHDLKGAIRNCGCGPGSLGGIDHLAALPKHLALIAGDLDRRCVLTGEIAGNQPALPDALANSGWAIGDPRLRFADADTNAYTNAYTDPAVLAVLSSRGPNHRKRVDPLGDGGMVILALLSDAGGALQEHLIIPVDASLPSDPGILARFAAPRVAVDAQANPSAACATCHAAAHTQWVGSAHAHAFAVLPEEHQTADCIGCHTWTPDQAAQPVANVSCQSCHLGTEAHIRAPTTHRTTGRVDCRTCHDARHDPDFDPAAGWEQIRHGR